jgi:hypothetical protein
MFPISAVSAAKTERQIKPLPANSRCRLNGNLFGPNRELNMPNRELYRRMSRATAAHQKRTRKRPITPSRRNGKIGRWYRGSPPLVRRSSRATAEESSATGPSEPDQESIQNLNELPLLLVIPAKAGIQSRQGCSGCSWTPAFAGMTIIHCKGGIHFGSGSQVSTVRSAVIDGMKKYAAAVSSTNCFGIVSVVRRFPAG